MQPFSYFITISGLECALYNLRHFSFSGPADILPLQYNRSWCEALGSRKILAFERFWLSTLKVTVNPERHIRFRRVGENKREQGGIIFSTTSSYIWIRLLEETTRNLWNQNRDFFCFNSTYNTNMQTSWWLQSEKLDLKARWICDFLLFCL